MESERRNQNQKPGAMIPGHAIFLLLLSPCFVSSSDPRTTESSLYCGTSNPVQVNDFTTGFVRNMQELSAKVGAQRWGTSFVNALPPIYGLAQCYADLSLTDCVICFAAIRSRIPRCLPATSARIYLDGCFLRYDTRAFYNQTLDPALDSVNCTHVSRTNPGESSAPDFPGTVSRALGDARAVAVSSGRGFGVAEASGAVEKVYALAQCWRTLSREQCRRCLENAGNRTRRCLPKREGRGLNAGCYLRYSTAKFYDQDGSASSGGKLKKGILLLIVLATTAFFLLSLCAAFAAYIKLSKMKKERDNLSHVSPAFRKSSFYFKYNTLEKATNYFDPLRKLGQGGAGSVFWGGLPDGRTVAVKRLVFNTRQWVDDFFNEVNLIGGIQHKNLVKLLGCSIEGPESLLVYEYVPNKSIDDLMSGRRMLEAFNWKQRLNIIIGTSEGLAYLHEGAPTTIIHRDIKGSNILLDENLNPKIADFGLVRCLEPDKSHLTTGVAGTLGYMAPEYLVRGQLTDKADVYSFGVLILEIVCGRKNTVLVQGSASLLQTVWKLYKSNRLPEVMDPSLKGDFTMEEASKVIQIGLSCAQASASSRPSMSETVKMLTCIGYPIPDPGQPPFLNANELDPSHFVMSSSGSVRIERCPADLPSNLR